MKILNICISALFLVPVSAGVASAQESGSSSKYHPFLSDNFFIGLGVYRPSYRHEIGADPNTGGSPSESFDEPDSLSIGVLDFHWRYTKNWSFQGTYWDVDSESERTLTKNFEFQGQEFQAGSFVKAGVDTSITRLFWGRSFFRKPSTDWGVGIGLHAMDIDAFVEGQILAIPGPGLEFQREGASASVPLPNIGIWYMYSWSPNWVVTTRLDWLDVTFDEFSGSMTDLSAGVNYQMSDHFGIGLALNAFKLDVRVDGTNWKGSLVNEQIGPRLNVTWNW